MRLQIGAKVALMLGVTSLLTSCATHPRAAPADRIQFPVKAERFITQFKGAEGITFNGEGQLFIGANKAIWIAQPNGSVRKIADVYLHLGQAGIGPRDILAADFGPTNPFTGEPFDEHDGIVWRITPEGKKTVFATGIGDPNVVLQLKDGTWLVSDDAVDKIYQVKNGKVTLWSNAVAFPNGLALSKDGKSLYVAQIFSRLHPRPADPDNRIWVIPIAKGKPAGPARLAFRTKQGPDGLVADEYGRIYVADNGSDSIIRFDPATQETVTIAEGVPAVASLVFGEGKFDHESLYATSTARGNGTIWRIKVGVRGARPYR